MLFSLYIGCSTFVFSIDLHLQPYSKSKLELNSKKSNSSDIRYFCLCLYFTFFCDKSRTSGTQVWGLSN